MAKLQLFVDTNIIIDLLADRRPFSNAAFVLFREAKLKKWKLYTSSNSILTTFFILEKQLNSKEANHAISTILKRLEIQDLTKKDLQIALKSKTEDLEDACQIECANKMGTINYIVTRDKKGSRDSIIEIINPDELVALYSG